MSTDDRGVSATNVRHLHLVHSAELPRPSPIVTQLSAGLGRLVNGIKKRRHEEQLRQAEHFEGRVRSYAIALSVRDCRIHDNGGQVPDFEFEDYLDIARAELSAKEGAGYRMRSV